MTETPSDDAVRARVRGEHDTSFVITAGAGTGKTTLLVDRIVSVVLAGRLPLDAIAAVTFTENAAGTLKLRVRGALEAARASAADARVRERAERALEAIERAQVSTIHALCGAILQERPVEAGVPPGFRVADEALADLLFHEAWEEWLQDRLTSPHPLIEAALASGIAVERDTPFGEQPSLRRLARRLIEHRDLDPHVNDVAFDAAAARAGVLERFARCRTLTEGKPDADGLVAAVRGLESAVESLRGLEGPELLNALSRLPVKKPSGNKRSWKADADFDECKTLLAAFADDIEVWRRERAAAFYSGLVASLGPVLASYERRKVEAGLLDYVDLLVRARSVLRDDAAVRDYFRAKWRAVIVDEYQDTDPLQVDIIERLAGIADPPAGGPPPGSLVIVGDPKQSIYRFRRADASVFAAACEAAPTRPGAALVSLTQNFRSAPAILRFSNAVFGATIRKSVLGQPDYEALRPRGDIGDGPALIGLGFKTDADPDESRDDESRDALRAEAAILAGFAAAVSQGALEVRDETSDDARARRASRGADVLILARRLTNLRQLEAALDRAGVPYVVDGGRSFFDRAEVIETHAVLRAIDDPSDRLSVVAALRSMYFGASDRDIAEWVFAGHPLRPATFDADAAKHPVGRALALLHAYHERRSTLSAPALIEALFDDTSLFAALAAASGGADRARPRIANLRKIVHFARSSRALGLLTLRGFNRFLASRFEGGGEEPDLPAARPGDPRTARIMTIHRAKGLEAPIVALYDCMDLSRPARSPDVVPLRDRGRVALGFVRDCQPPDWDTLVLREQAKLEEELHRLRYVACTRARDWLVVPIPPPTEQVGAFWKDVAKGVTSAPAADKLELPVRPFELPDLPGDPESADAASDPEFSAARWRARREALLEAARRAVPQPVSVREDALVDATPAVLPPSFVGRDFGAFVHRLLELADFSSPGSVRDIARSLAASFPLKPDAVVRAEAQAEAALALPIMREAARAERLFRETPISYVEDDRLLEGVCDLAFQDESGWVVVDYKTEAITDDQLQAQAAHHAAQLRRYARGLALASGANVSRRFVIFTSLGRQVAV